MTNGAPAMLGTASDGRPAADDELLVITDERRRGSDALALPFRAATVLELGPQIGTLPVTESFDTVVIDRGPLDLRWLDALVPALRPAVRPGGRLLVILDVEGPTDAEEPVAGRLTGLKWAGLGSLNGRPYAALELAEGSTEPAAQLLTAAIAVRLGAAEGAARRDVEVATALAGAERDRRLSETALLGQLGTLADRVEKLNKELKSRPQAPGGQQAVRAILVKSEGGRKMLGVLRRGKRLAGKVKRKLS
ncbi:hypothetical protein [Micromonospora siamensis]|uniref:Methyltransferase domain-containing protein n=1 Tax=Micromonospora siamensis TaxID=299152 RepID=A0A1C5HGJ2_9ACTN|nr:hypothetical protein [Micromonospora siamensis]SCG45120.1 hypothetical protein GA0074704_1691 [Micromonospora siamensis]